MPHESASACYIETTSHDGLDSLAELLAQRDADFFCLNDGSAPEVDEAYRAATVADFLACYFPSPAPWELDWAGQRHQPQDMPRRAASRVVPAATQARQAGALLGAAEEGARG